jgi:pimeloyl-ACP methyl ester carboxylesterase
MSQVSEQSKAIYFRSGAKTLFGWLHTPPAGNRCNLGVVICKPFGYEAICAQRSLRTFAQAAALLGAPTLRFDYSGTGDSADLDPQTDQLAVWSENIVSAVEELRQRTGVDRVCLLGVRMGALLATVAADKCGAVDSLILVAPIISGKKHLREMRTTRLAASLSSGAQVQSSGPIEVSGFSLSEATLSSLARVDLKARAAPAVSDMLIVDGDYLPVAKAWAEQLATAGPPTTYKVLPGIVEMIMTAPQFASVPQAIVEAMRDWLSTAITSAKRPDTAHDARLLPEDPVSVLKLGSATPSRHSTITERPVNFGRDGALFGILTEPHDVELRRRAVILVNAGADYHIGASGMNVGLARTWAQSGYVVLRMDFAGIGDSATRPGRPDDEVFPPAAVDDVRAAVEFVRSRNGVGDITIVGLCSGAYHALQCGMAALPVNRLLMVNPQNYYWKAGMSIYDVQVAELISHPSVQGKRLSIDQLRRLFTGKIDIRYMSKVFARRIGFLLESTLRRMARTLRIRMPQDLGQDLEAIASRGVRMVFVFSRGEPGIELLRIQAGSSLKRVADSCAMHIIDGADHVFSNQIARSVLAKILSDELYARVECNGEPDSENRWPDRESA